MDSVKNGMKVLIPKLCKLILGFFIIAVGIVTVYQANIGLGAWEVLHDGISKTFPIISYGQASIVVGLLVLCVGVAAKEKIGLGTLLNILVIGNMVDLVMWLGFIPEAPNSAIGLIMGVVGTAIHTFGIYFYIAAGLGAGPRDTFLVVATRKTGKPVGLCRCVIELTAVVIGFFMGGSVGLGTIIIALIAGPMMQLIFALVKFDIKSVKHLSFYDTAKLFAKK